MGKLDTTSISGFDSMTAEEKVEALLGIDIPDSVDMSLYIDKAKYDKLKSANDKTSSEISSLKKQLSERMSDEEKAKAEADTSRQELEDKYNALLKETTIAKYAAKFLAQGYDEALAKKTAEALANGDMDTVFQCGEKYREALTKAVKAETLKDTPRPMAGEGTGADKVDPEITLAQTIGKSTAAANKITSDILSKYL